MKLLREYIRELVAEQNEFGKYVWPSAIKGHPMADEPDTVIEEMLYQQLHNHFGAIAPLTDGAIAVIKRLLDTGAYPDVFRRCEKAKVYRGLRLPLSWLEANAPEVLQNLPDKKDPIDWLPAVEIRPVVYEPQGKYGSVSSWTDDWKQARMFTTRHRSGTVPVILHANCDSGYFMSTLGLKRFKGGRYADEFDIKKLNPNAHEREILLFGECTVTAIQVNLTKRDLERLG